MKKKLLVIILIILTFITILSVLFLSWKSSEEERYKLDEKFKEYCEISKESFTNEELKDSEYFEDTENFSDVKDSSEVYIPNQNDYYKDVYTSNIEVNLDDIDKDPYSYSWYSIPANPDYWYNIYQWVAYAINTYYSGNVPETFSCTIPEDIIHQETNMIFTVQVKSQNITLNILLDTYNNKIIVNEV